MLLLRPCHLAVRQPDHQPLPFTSFQSELLLSCEAAGGASAQGRGVGEAEMSDPRTVLEKTPSSLKAFKSGVPAICPPG